MVASTRPRPNAVLAAADGSGPNGDGRVSVLRQVALPKVPPDAPNPAPPPRHPLFRVPSAVVRHDSVGGAARPIQAAACIEAVARCAAWLGPQAPPKRDPRGATVPRRPVRVPHKPAHVRLGAVPDGAPRQRRPPTAGLLITAIARAETLQGLIARQTTPTGPVVLDRPRRRPTALPSPTEGQVARSVRDTCTADADGLPKGAYGLQLADDLLFLRGEPRVETTNRLGSNDLAVGAHKGDFKNRK